jgi:hypothetical protein
MTPPPGGRKRHANNYPSHIKPELIPENVSYKAKEGYWRIAYYDDDGKRRFKRLCGKAATLSQIHQAVEALKIHTVVCFKSLSIEFQKSHDWQELGRHTKRDYLACHKMICEAGDGKVLFGDIPYTKWKKSTVLNYRNFRGEESKSRANKELSYIKRVLSWAKLYEFIKDNIADGVPKLTVPPRQHYAEDTDFNFLIQVARESNYWYMPYVLELGYECRMRSIEILEMTDANETAEGLLINRHKGSKNNITLWNDNLRKTWDEAKAKRNAIWAMRKQPIPFEPENRFIFISERTGNPINEQGLQTAKTRISNLAKKKAEQLGIRYINFTIHDTKRKGVSDTEGDKLAASGHRSLQMLNVYDVSRPKVESTRGSKKAKKDCDEK